MSLKKQFKLIQSFPVKTSVIYAAWLNSEQHSNMTSGEAKCSDQEGESFSAWDGYISGINKELIENKKIVQAWRTTEFKESDEDSVLTIELAESNEGCELTLTHSNIPEGEADYKQGWLEYYFEPMMEYFTK